MEKILTVFEMIRSYSKIPQSYFQILLKLIGISFICEFASNICKDAGQASIAKQIDKEIEVDYLDQDFKEQHGKYSGWTAQIIQHEIDHCKGIVI